jgi:hypothetical protein
VTPAEMESAAIMTISRVHVEQLETVPEGHWEIWVIACLFLYAAILSILFIVKKHEFTPFENVREQYLQVNPFGKAILVAATPKFQGKGVVVKLNTMCNSLIEPSPEFNYLLFSQNMLGALCAKCPSEVNFVVSIQNENQQIIWQKNKHKIVYRLQKRLR